MKNKYLLIINLLFVCLFYNTQQFCVGQNLVPNPSFEVYTFCPCGGNDINLASPWYNPGTISTDYYNACDLGTYGVPANIFGYQFAHTGVAYASIFGYLTGSGRGYIGVELSDSLLAGKKYCASFYVSLADSSSWAISELGAYFSKTKIIKTNPWPFPYIPQIESSRDLILDDMQNWTLIQGEFIASGGEKFMTIGNYKYDANTTVISTGIIGGILCDAAVYYIDDVSVTLCDTNTSAFENINNEIRFSLFPNPSNGPFTLRYSNSILENAYLRVLNMLGTLVHQQTLQNQPSQQIDLSHLADGMYYVRVYNKERSWVEKVAIQR